MKFDEIRKLEDREKDGLMTIHFYLENDWWRAYEWSAYLCSIFPNNLEGKNKLNVTHKENDLAIVGLKLTSFEKYLPNVKTSQLEEKHLTVNVSDFIKDDSISFETYKDILAEWKQKFPIKKDDKPKSVKPVKNDVFEEEHLSLTSVLKEVLSYPLESKTLIDNVRFIMHLKEELSKII